MNSKFHKPFLDAVCDGAVATSLESEILHWSKGAEQAFGFTEAEALQKNIFELLLPADLVEEELSRCLHAREHGLRFGESIRRRRDGTLAYFDISVKKVSPGTDEADWLLWQHADVTEARLRRDAGLLRATFGHVLESMPDAIVMVNITGRIAVANAQAERVFGYGAGELAGLPIEALIPKRFHGGHVGHRVGYFSSPRARPMGAGLELYGQRKDGTEFPVEISLSPLPTTQGTMAISAIRDISQRKEVERELQKKNGELQAANRELEAFSYSISHDLRAPIRAMSGFARVLSLGFNEQTSPDVRHAVDRIRSNAKRMDELIDGLLSFSSLSRRPLMRSRVSPSKIVRQMMAELEPETRHRNVRVEIEEMPECHADKTLLGQVYANLLSNALKYSRGSDPAIIRVGAKMEEGGPVYFVSDNGVGFDIRYADKLFGVFQRLHSGSEFEGNGVGLAIVQRIVQRHGGKINAASEIGRGSTFSFTLDEAGAGGADASSAPQSSGAESRTQESCPSPTH